MYFFYAPLSDLDDDYDITMNVFPHFLPPSGEVSTAPNTKDWISGRSAPTSLRRWTEGKQPPTSRLPTPQHLRVTCPHEDKAPRLLRCLLLPVSLSSQCVTYVTNKGRKWYGKRSPESFLTSDPDHSKKKKKKKQ